MNVAIVTFERFNEIDSFVALSILNRLTALGVRAELVSPNPRVTSMNGVQLEGCRPLEVATEADAVLIGSGRGTVDVIADGGILPRLRLDPERQLIGSQCSGALILAQLDLLDGMPACTDVSTRPLLEKAGVEVLDRAFRADGNIATAGGCLASQYLCAWVLHRTLGQEAVARGIGYVAPVGQEDEYIARALAAVAPVGAEP